MKYQSTLKYLPHLSLQSWIILLLAILCICSSHAQESQIGSRIIGELKSQYLDQNDEDGFWLAVKGYINRGEYPFVETVDRGHLVDKEYVKVSFLYRAEEVIPDNVLLLANVNHVLPSEMLFERLGPSDVYFKTIQVPARSRFMYRIIENDSMGGLFAAAKYGSRQAVLGRDPDPLAQNKQTIPNAFGPGIDFTVAWVELPGAQKQEYLIDRGSPMGSITIEEHFNSKLGYAHQITTFLPPGYNSNQAYPIMFILDGSSYFRMAGLKTTLENLIAAEEIPPLIVIGIDAGQKDGRSQRNTEFTCNEKFAAYISEDLIPWTESKYRVDSSPTSRIFAGSSFGGLFAAYYAFHHPNDIGKVLSLSGSFHWGKEGENYGFEWLVDQFAFKEFKPIKLYLEAGILEGEYHWDDPHFPNQIVNHRHFTTILKMRGYDFKYSEFRGGHEMLSWRGGIADGLIDLLGDSEEQ